MKNSNRGAITVFHAIVFMALLVLAGVFIDAARIAVADRKVQSSLNTAARSALAGYNEELVGEYGLFGLDTESKNGGLKDEVFKYFKVNLEERHKGIKLIKYDINKDKISVEGMSNLLTEDTFKQQVVSYMKYKAPITISENVIEKFKQIKLGPKVNFSEKEKLARGQAQNIKGSITKLNNTVKEIGKSVTTEAINELKTILKDVVKKDAQEAIDKLKKLQDDYKNARDTVISINNGLSEYNKVKEEANAAAREAGASRTQGQFGYESDNMQIETNLTRNIDRLNEVVDKITTLKQQIDNIKKDAKGLQSDIDSKTKEIQELIDSLQLEQINEIPIGDSYDIPQKSEAEIKNDEKNKGSFLELQQAVKEKMLIKSINADWKISDQEFKDAAELDAEKYNNVSKNMKESEELKDEKIAEEQNNSILHFMSDFMSLLSNAATNARDNIYITEYIMDKYTFVTSKTERGHYFNKGEVEYILWGEDTQASNVGLVFGQVLFIRFAIDTVDYFVTSKIPHPVARLIQALIEGGIQSLVDVYELYTTKEGCNICPSIKSVKISYSEHLRIFLLLQSESKKLNRMRQIMQVNLIQNDKDFRMKNCNTIIKASAEVKINLWFIPLLQVDKLKIGSFRDGKYIIMKEVMTGY